MERWLNSRPALIAAWAILGSLAAGLLAVLLYIALPTVRGTSDDGSRPVAPLTVIAAPSGTPAGKNATVPGIVERVEGQALTLHRDTGEPVRIILRRGTLVGKVADGSATDITEG